VRTVQIVAGFTTGLNVSSQPTPAICDPPSPIRRALRERERERELEVATVVEDTAADDDMVGEEDMVWQQWAAQEREAQHGRKLLVGATKEDA